MKLTEFTGYDDKSIMIDTDKISEGQQWHNQAVKDMDQLKSTIAQLEVQLKDAIANASYWVAQHGLETEKRGEAEHQLDLARGDRADSFELIERERDSALARLKEANETIERIIDPAEAGGGIVAELRTELATLRKDKEILVSAIQEIRSANNNEFGYIADSGIEEIISGIVTVIQGTNR